MGKSYSSSIRSELEDFLENLDLPVAPSIHINGNGHPTAIVVVDFGAPTDPVRLTADQNQELTSKLRKFTKELLKNKDIFVRVSSDNYAGVVYWSALQ